MKYFQTIGYAKMRGKDTWDRFKDSAVFACPDNENPYTFFPKDYKNIFDYWLVEYKEVVPPRKGVD